MEKKLPNVNLRRVILKEEPSRIYDKCYYRVIKICNPDFDDHIYLSLFLYGLSAESGRKKQSFKSAAHSDYFYESDCVCSVISEKKRRAGYCFLCGNDAVFSDSSDYVPSDI